MTGPSRFRVPIDDLESASRVDPEDMVESVVPVVEPSPDPRGEDPDRSWFASGA